MFLLAPSRGTYRVSRKSNPLIPSRSIITYLFHPAKWLYQSILPFCKLSSQSSFGVLFLLLSKLSWKLSLFFFWFKKRHLRRTAYQRTVLIFFFCGNLQSQLSKKLKWYLHLLYFPFFLCPWQTSLHSHVKVRLFISSSASCCVFTICIFPRGNYSFQGPYKAGAVFTDVNCGQICNISRSVFLHCSVFLILVNWGWRGGFFAEFTVWEDTFVQANRHILRKMHVVVLMKCESGADKTEIDCNVHVHGTFTP